MTEKITRTTRVSSNNSMKTLVHKSCNNNTEIVGENNKISGGFSKLLNPMEISMPNIFNWNHVPNIHPNDNDKKLMMDKKKLTRDSTQVTNTNR